MVKEGSSLAYIFENENALEIYIYLTKELGIHISPAIIDDEFYYIGEEYMNDTLTALNREFDYDRERKKFTKKS